MKYSRKSMSKSRSKSKTKTKSRNTRKYGGGPEYSNKSSPNTVSVFGVSPNKKLVPGVSPKTPSMSGVSPKKPSVSGVFSKTRRFSPQLPSQPEYKPSLLARLKNKFTRNYSSTETHLPTIRIKNEPNIREIEKYTHYTLKNNANNNSYIIANAPSNLGNHKHSNKVPAKSILKTIRNNSANNFPNLLSKNTIKNISRNPKYQHMSRAEKNSFLKAILMRQTQNTNTEDPWIWTK